jgi:hypothetical protein
MAAFLFLAYFFHPQNELAPTPLHTKKGKVWESYEKDIFRKKKKSSDDEYFFGV